MCPDFAKKWKDGDNCSVRNGMASEHSCFLPSSSEGLKAGCSCRLPGNGKAEASKSRAASVGEGGGCFGEFVGFTLPSCFSRPGICCDFPLKLTNVKTTWSSLGLRAQGQASLLILINGHCSSPWCRFQDLQPELSRARESRIYRFGGALGRRTFNAVSGGDSTD